MVVRRALADALPNQGHFFNAEVPAKRLTPAGPDHAQVAACAGIVDYIDAVHAHHHTDEAPPVERARRVLALQSAREARLLAPLLDYLAARNDLRLLGPRDAARRAPTVADAPALTALRRSLEETLRLHPAAPLLSTRRAIRPITVGPWRLPAGTLLLLPVQLAQRDFTPTFTVPQMLKDVDLILGEGNRFMRDAKQGIDDYLAATGDERPGPGLAVALSSNSFPASR